ncbi:MAG: CRISPR-associated endonuclease Cas2 [Clostridiales bacterium]|jgi:CRISPR-associated protein Cas2|nr:CRISPR-associated endonuclease Cas2 [Eubacteriales bacterium]MDH7567306.1 CRISPR-associated endonuclease Cas2 [Clostridiales bacterium]
MFVILVYDVGEKRVQKVLKIARKYLYRVQNSVFEGEITDASLAKLKDELERKIVKDEDSVLFYLFRTTRYSERQYMGLKKGGQDLIV